MVPLPFAAEVAHKLEQSRKIQVGGSAASLIPEPGTTSGRRERILFTPIPKTIIGFRDIIAPEKKLTKWQEPSRVEKLRRMRDLYREVYDIKEEAHDIFSYPLLVATATIFGNVVFFVFVNTMQLKYGSSLTMVTFLVSFYYPITLILKLGVIVSVCHAFKEMTKSLRRKTAELFEQADSNRERDIVSSSKLFIRFIDITGLQTAE